jgi:hypothetical protein
MNLTSVLLCLVLIAVVVLVVVVVVVVVVMAEVMIFLPDLRGPQSASSTFMNLHRRRDRRSFALSASFPPDSASSLRAP